MLIGFWPAELISPRFDAFPSPDTAQRTYVKKSLPNCCAGFRPAIFPRLMSISKKPGRRFRIKNSDEDPEALWIQILTYNDLSRPTEESLRVTSVSHEARIKLTIKGASGSW